VCNFYVFSKAFSAPSFHTVFKIFVVDFSLDFVNKVTYVSLLKLLLKFDLGNL